MRSRGETTAIVQQAAELAAIGKELDALVAEGTETVRGAIHHWRCRFGAALLRARDLIPRKGKGAVAWRAFLESRDISPSTAQNWMKLAAHVAQHPEEASSLETTEDAYRAIGIKKERLLSTTSCALNAGSGGAPTKTKRKGRQVIDPDSPTGQMLASKPLADPDPPARTADPGAETPTTDEEETDGDDQGAVPALREDAEAYRPALAEAVGRATVAEARVAELETEVHRLRNELQKESLRREAAEERVRELEADGARLRDMLESSVRRGAADRATLLRREASEGGAGTDRHRIPSRAGAEHETLPRAPLELTVERDPDQAAPTGEESQERRRPAKKAAKGKAPAAPLPEPREIGDQVILETKKHGDRRAVVLWRHNGEYPAYALVLRADLTRKLKAILHPMAGGEQLRTDPNLSDRKAAIQEGIDVLMECTGSHRDPGPPMHRIEALRKAQG